MNRRPLIPLCLAALLLASGCSSPLPKPAIQSHPGFATVGAEVRSTRIYVDVLAVSRVELLAIGETRDGVPVVNIAHASAAGRAAISALQEEFTARGFRAASVELTSMGLGGPPTQILLTRGSEAPVLSTLPVYLSTGLSGSQRGDWITSLYSAVHTFASGGQARATLAATFLNPNTDRIEVFAVLSGGGGSIANIWAVAFDSRSGKVLWSGSASETAAVLDTAVATSLARSLVRDVPRLPAATNGR